MIASPTPSRLLPAGLSSWLLCAVIAPPLLSGGFADPPVLARDSTPGHPVSLTTGEGLGDWIAFYVDLLPVTIICGLLALVAATGIVAIHARIGRYLAPVVFPLAMLWPARPLTAIIDPDNADWPLAYLSGGPLAVLLACHLIAGAGYVVLITLTPKPPTAAVEGSGD